MEEIAETTEKAQEWHPLEIPELGIDFKRFKSDKMTKFICAWHNDTDSHLYEIEVKHHPVGTGWMAVGYNDGNAIFTITATGRWLITNMAIAAMRTSLKHTHHHALKSYRDTIYRDTIKKLAVAVVADSGEDMKGVTTGPYGNPFED